MRVYESEQIWSRGLVLFIITRYYIARISIITKNCK